MKISIHKSRNLLHNVWIVEFNNQKQQFNTQLDAFKYANKTWTRFYKENAAFSMSKSMNVEGLTIDEKDFICKLIQSKCSGITAKQYGYLKGIYERQERAW